MDWGGKEGGASKEGGKGEPYRGPPTGGGGAQGGRKRTPKGACAKGGGASMEPTLTPTPYIGTGVEAKGKGGGEVSLGMNLYPFIEECPRRSQWPATCTSQPLAPPYSVHGQPGFYTALGPPPPAPIPKRGPQCFLSSSFLSLVVPTFRCPQPASARQIFGLGRGK